MYRAIERHGTIGDRRTAALVAADGTVDWLCALRYDGVPVFGAILDDVRGGACRLAPASPACTEGRQRYEDDTPILVTRWEVPGSGVLEVVDAMVRPQHGADEGPPRRNVLVRRAVCRAGTVDVAVEIDARDGFGSAPARGVDVWRSPRLGDRTTLRAGESATVVITIGEPPAEPWSDERAAADLEATRRYWRGWVRGLQHPAMELAQVRRSALTVHLLGYAPCGSLVAAPTTSLPERPGGDWNADYRLAWVRDASLSLANVAVLGDETTACGYLHWLADLPSTTESPLQVLYAIDGNPNVVARARFDLDGYRGARPVRFGNHAVHQKQLDSFGYLLECVDVYLRHGGGFDAKVRSLVRRCAEYIARHWTEPDQGIWELPVAQHYVSSRVMSWVALDRAVGIFTRAGLDAEAVARWRTTSTRIHEEVMERGWSSRLGAFKQRYEGENLDASALLVPLTGFLPPTHPRSIATIERIARDLTSADGCFVYRFRPDETPGLQPRLPMGRFEGAFLPCTFWLAACFAKIGRVERALDILGAAEAIAGPLGVFAEGVDPALASFAGNTPLLFSQVEYLRAHLEVRAATSRRAA